MESQPKKLKTEKAEKEGDSKDLTQMKITDHTKKGLQLLCIH